MGLPPERPKIYHIVHVNRLTSILRDGCLWSDAEMSRRDPQGAVIGISHIKRRRLTELTLHSRPGLLVGHCVPFYLCPRSIMLYLISCQNHPDLRYRDGQGPIIHLEADMREAVAWAEGEGLRWAFTLSNAGARYFEDRCDLRQLGEVDWAAVHATSWTGCKEGKQAEFLMENRFPWNLVRRIGVCTPAVHQQVAHDLSSAGQHTPVEIIPEWYYP